ncbi:MAG: hypothetical protein WDO73_19340 [Ignavibacteriota bacterium]
MTTGQKFKTTARTSFDPVEFAWYGLQAGISQWEGADKQYGQGLEGYAKRYGVRFADGTLENFFTRAIFASALHQDPRYFQMGEGRFFRRVTYSVSRIFVTRSDSGTSQFNFSEILARLLRPAFQAIPITLRDSRDVSDALHIWATQLGWDTLSNVIKEFWP